MRPKFEAEPGGVHSNEDNQESVLNNRERILNPDFKLDWTSMQDLLKLNDVISVVCVSDCPPTLDPWTSCDGRKYTDEEIKAFEAKAIKDEDYEFAAKCRDEIERRDREALEELLNL